LVLELLDVFRDFDILAHEFFVFFILLEQVHVIDWIVFFAPGPVRLSIMRVVIAIIIFVYQVTDVTAIGGLFELIDLLFEVLDLNVSLFHFQVAFLKVVV